MEKHRLEDMMNGWFIGNFKPTLYDTKEFEVALKFYKEGDNEARHHHKVATEFTVIINGIVEMNGQEYVKGDIIKITPGISTNFRALSEVTTLVVKIPSESEDKFID